MRRIWVTRDEGSDGPLCRALAAAGLEPVCAPVVSRRIVADLAATLAGLGPSDWLVLTSPYTINNVPAHLIGCRTAVVGEASRQAAAARGIRVDLVSAEANGVSLWRDLAARLEGGERICYPRSDLANPPAEIGGMKIDSPVFYSTLPCPFDAALVRDAAAAAVASPSAARVVAGLKPPPRCGSIGPTTSAALRSSGIEPWLESPSASFESLAAAIARAMRDEQGD
jgi:uroporphyrinogen-III synthase